MGRESGLKPDRNPTHTGVPDKPSNLHLHITKSRPIPNFSSILPSSAKIEEEGIDSVS